jgi:hypothetical protein
VIHTYLIGDQGNIFIEVELNRAEIIRIKLLVYKVIGIVLNNTFFFFKKQDDNLHNLILLLNQGIKTLFIYTTNT